MNFKVGQKVVCVKPHSKNAVKVGQIYTVLSTNSGCNCTAIDVGVRYNEYIGMQVRCRKCGCVVVEDGVWYIGSSLFAPINTSTADIANQIFETCNDVKEIKIPELV